MKVVTWEGVVENGQIRLLEDIRLPENARVYVVVPPQDQKPLRVFSPRLLHPEGPADSVRETADDLDQ